MVEGLNRTCGGEEREKADTKVFWLEGDTILCRLGVGLGREHGELQAA